MAVIPEVVSKSWKKRVGPAVFSTVNSGGVPNSVYVNSVWMYDSDTIIIADNYFDKTRKNIFNGCKSCLLFLTDENKSFQIKGSIEYHKTGVIYDEMKKRNPLKLPGHAAVALKVTEVFSGSERL
jgi:predicted pyridoxine 5'-phosphate oxidase superfamily flavin-nucleotide-binding protein